MGNQKSDVSDSDFERLSGLFRILADPTRLRILLRLAGGECNVTNLCADLQLPQPTVSHHLALLRAKQLVENQRRGKQVFYALYSETGDRQTPPSDVILTLPIEQFTVQLATAPAT